MQRKQMLCKQCHNPPHGRLVVFELVEHDLVPVGSNDGGGIAELDVLGRYMHTTTKRMTGA